MELQRKVNLKNLDNDRVVVDRLIDENMTQKLDQYLQKFKKDDLVCKVWLNIEKNKKWLFNWVLQILVDWKKFRYAREDYKKLDDLINHLFDHFKEKLAKK